MKKRRKNLRDNKKNYLSIFFIIAFFIIVLLGAFLPNLKNIFKNRAAETDLLINPFNSAVALNNSQYPRNNFITITRGPNLNLNSNFTVEFWLKILERKNYFNQTLLRIGQNINLFTESGLSATDKIALNISDGIVTDSAVGPELGLNKWNHIALTYLPNDPSNSQSIGKIVLYLNGISVLSKENIHFKDLLYQIEVGTSLYNGELDEIRISNTVRYDQNSYFVPTMPFTSDLKTLALLHLDGDVNDSSGNGNNGSINNNVVFIKSTVPFIYPPYARVFITSSTYNGNLGGLSGADAKCQTSADTVNLGGTWKAWLSNNTVSASSRLIHSNLPYRLIDGTLIADNWTDLVDGKLLNTITLTETGAYHGNYVWTGTNDRGEIHNPGVSKCAEWLALSNNSPTGSVGHSGYTDYQWTWGSSLNCASSYPLYCIEQIQPIEIPTPTNTPTPTKRPIPTEIFPTEPVISTRPRPTIKIVCPPGKTNPYYRKVFSSCVKINLCGVSNCNIK